MTNDSLKYLQDLWKDDLIGLFELEFARFLTRNYPETRKEALYCCLLAVHDQLNGNICTDISNIKESPLFEVFNMNNYRPDELISFLKKEEYVGIPGDYKPFVLNDNRLYLHKYWNFENELVEWLIEKIKVDADKLPAQLIDTDEFFGNTEDGDFQKVATVLALFKSFLVISGGPGTGKTYTVKKIIKALKVQNPDVLIAITAPTGKAAERLNESVSDENEEIEATTLHKLLGAGFNGEFKFNKGNKLFHDIVIVDEASMLDLRMWIGLIRALKKSARLIVLGDKDQLSSVEAGSVLGDICFKSDNTFSNQTLELLKNNGLSVTGSNSVNNLNDNVVLLNKTYRSKESTGIPQLASAINEQDFESIDGILEGSEHIDIVQPTSSVLSELIQTYSNEKIKGLNETQFLCSNKRGVFGTEHLNLLIENKIKDTLRIPAKIEWFEGRRILVTKNDAINGISNGEIGTCVQRNDGSLVIKFGENKEVEPLELKSFDLAYAITVHKSQGSEFRNVCIFLPEVFNPVLSKELLYTSVTRAKESALVIGDRELIKQIINTEIKRTSSISIKLSRNDLQK